MLSGLLILLKVNYLQQKEVSLRLEYQRLKEISKGMRASARVCRISSFYKGNSTTAIMSSLRMMIME